MSLPSPFVGRWTYRSFHNNPKIETPLNKLYFGAGTLVIEHPAIGSVGGTIGGDTWSLAIAGSYTLGNPFTLRFQGVGEVGGETWVYDYLGALVPRWPHEVGQRPAIVGSVIRTAAHSNGASPAGYVASFYAVGLGD